MNFVIIGCGRMGSGLAQALSLRGHAVAVVDRNPHAFEVLNTGFKGRTVTGVGIDRDVLERAGINQADGLAAVTDSDETNVIAARIARTALGVPHVVARVYDPRKAEVYRRLGVQTISTTAWGVNRIADLLTMTELHVVSSLDADVNLVEATVTPSLVGRAASELNLPGEIVLASISRAGHGFLPRPGTRLEPGDRLHLAVLASAQDRLHALGLD